MKTRVIRSWIILGLLALYIVLYKFFILRSYIVYSNYVSASFIAAILSLSIILLGYVKTKSTDISKKVFKTVMLHIIVAFIIMYGMGLIAGFSMNTHSLVDLFNNGFMTLLIIVFIEFIRYVFIMANKNKKLLVILLTILLIVLELVTTIRVFNINDFVSVFTISTTIVLPCIFKNLLLSYLTYNVGYKTPIVYRTIMDMYMLVIPIIPKLGNYVSSMIFISLPILVYINTFGIIDGDGSEVEPVVKKSRFTIVDKIFGVVIIALITLLSGIFPIYMIGIGSGSMQPVINKGDAIILEKVNDNSSGKITIVHRINKIEKAGYIMKGDANNGTDLHPVDRSQIQGIYKFKIPYIAWPTIWLTELLKSGG